MYPVAVVPRSAWTEGQAKGVWKLHMLIKYEVERDIAEYLGAHYSIEPDGSPRNPR